ncbi:hypothetical protein NC796_15690 [Aliifodinibius sp. S!AR15-10]|uniref:hypothetical protein n=1 Tax=Aliifodinibius sp. S!AR15-10 TaxID=2950437 RepID=UPI00285E102A|nr:hypothetical protein [Aliifodinibius sp. S!AR15-10]MDR8392598.1 hypothetical protein [Aliifodinibius sp. S!AR15-10]
MASGQTLLTLAAIVLFMITALNVNRNYVQAVEQNLDQQKYINAINYGESLADEFYSQASNYENAEDVYGDYDDVTDPNRRLEKVTTMGDTLYATIHITEQELKHNVVGKKGTITVYGRNGSEYRQRAQYEAAISNID